MRQADRHSPKRLQTQRVLATVAESSRRGWLVCEVSEGGHLSLAIVRCTRTPNGAFHPTSHRSVMKHDTLIAIAVALTAGKSGNGGAQ